MALQEDRQAHGIDSPSVRVRAGVWHGVACSRQVVRVAAGGAHLMQPVLGDAQCVPGSCRTQCMMLSFFLLHCHLFGGQGGRAVFA